ncbi:MAG: gamma-glutamylcyclotransferase family protein [Pseudomonadota bacterium]
MMRLRYLAYGSNLHPARLRARVPSAKVLGSVRLDGYGLRFHKRGRDGSAKCDLLPVEPPEHAYAAVYTMAADEKPLLDRVEGLGTGYDLAWMCLPDYGDVFFYRAMPDQVDHSLKPYDWYHAFVSEGARHHGFPKHYRSGIAACESRPDPDIPRRNLNLGILGSGIATAPLALSSA